MNLPSSEKATTEENVASPVRDASIFPGEKSDPYRGSISRTGRKQSNKGWKQRMKALQTSKQLLFAAVVSALEWGVREKQAGQVAVKIRIVTALMILVGGTSDHEL